MFFDRKSFKIYLQLYFYQILKEIMSMNSDFYLFSNTRFQPFGLTHNPIMGNSLMGARMMNASMYKSIHSLKTQMPSDVLELFKANQISFLKPIFKKKCRSLDPLTFSTFNILDKFPQFENFEEKQQIETQQMKKNKFKNLKKEQAKIKLQAQIQKWNPFQDSNILSDPYKTLIVSRLNYKTTDRTLKLQFQKYGIVKSVRIVKDKQGKSQGYGFVQFDRKEDFINAYKSAHLRRIDGRRVVVDYQKGRTILMWRPRRLGGGQGDLRLTKQQFNNRQRIAAFRNQQRQQKKKQKESEKKKSRSRSRSKERKDRKQKKDRDKKDYEFERYEKQERYNVQRNERYDRNERTDRNDRGERLDRGDRGDRAERTDRGDRAQRGDRGQRGQRNDRGDRVERTDRGDRDRDRGDRERVDRGQRQRGEKYDRLPQRTEKYEKKQTMEIEVSKEKKEKKQKKQKSRERSKKKQKKQKKEKKDKKQYVAMNVPVDQFK